MKLITYEIFHVTFLDFNGLWVAEPRTKAKLKLRPLYAPEQCFLTVTDTAWVSSLMSNFWGTKSMTNFWVHDSQSQFLVQSRPCTCSLTHWSPSTPSWTMFPGLVPLHAPDFKSIAKEKNSSNSTISYTKWDFIVREQHISYIPKDKDSLQPQVSCQENKSLENIRRLEGWPSG